MNETRLTMLYNHGEATNKQQVMLGNNGMDTAELVLEGMVGVTADRWI